MKRRSKRVEEKSHFDYAQCDKQVVMINVI